MLISVQACPPPPAPSLVSAGMAQYSGTRSGRGMWVAMPELRHGLGTGQHQEHWRQEDGQRTGETVPTASPLLERTAETVVTAEADPQVLARGWGIGRG